MALIRNFLTLGFGQRGSGAVPSSNCQQRTHPKKNLTERFWRCFFYGVSIRISCDKDAIVPCLLRPLWPTTSDALVRPHAAPLPHTNPRTDGKSST
jgi:hypothetical protein